MRGRVVVLVLVVLAACGSEAKDAAISELAVGTWACAPEGADGADRAFEVRIADGTFETSMGLGGTWAVRGGDLSLAFDGPRATEPVVVREFEALTLASTEITLEHAGFFEANDGGDDPSGEQPVEVEAHGTDAVTLTYPGGEPWTCERR